MFIPGTTFTTSEPPWICARNRLPVEGFVYTPFIAILFAAFRPFGFDASLILWGILQAILVILYLFAFRRLVPARLPIQLLFVALALSSFPLLHTLKWGQVSLFYTTSLLGMLVFVERDRLAFAAALLAFAVSFKFFPLIFLVPFIFRRDVRFLRYAVIACGALLIAVPCLLLGINSTWNFYSALLGSFRHFDWVMTSYNSQFFPHVMLRLVKGNGFDHAVFRFSTSTDFNLEVSLQILRGISYSIAALNVGFVYCLQRARLYNANLWSVHLLFLSIPFILPTSWPVDLVYLPFGQALLAWKIIGGDEALSLKRAFQARKVASLLLLLVSIVISNIIFFNLIGNRVVYGSIGFIFWSNLLLLVDSYMELLPTALQQIQVASGGAVLPDLAVNTGAAKLD